jgi:hypothetical protein
MHDFQGFKANYYSKCIGFHMDIIIDLFDLAFLCQNATAAEFF